MSALIGISMHPASSPIHQELDQFLMYIAKSVERAGGLPVFIPLELDDVTLRRLHDRLDGVLISGGDDVDPLAYGKERRVQVTPGDETRDRVEMSLVRWAVKSNKPALGICRGAQIMNVAMGGTLHWDVSEHTGAGRHDFYPDLPTDLLAHEIKIEEDSLLSRVIGKPILRVNSLHHQAVKDVAPGFHAVAHAPDGITEAIELPHHPFALGVQWHPEALPEQPEAQAVFKAFVKACQ
ncbi:MAG TPA: gamma-glutamyl-gamma-aminobutyrate hydrolase family protein [Thermoflexales bacterium]|nr:gamma-glutamyl-gamma-aminobutyrate hydrolase family protein [Thermoflexales bacterium]